MSAQDRLRPILVNRYEKVTDQLLTAAAAEHGDRLLAKVRVADVINVDGLTGEAKRYGLSAHFDFLMVEPVSSRPRFAVELDGAQHWTDPATRRRDRLKDQLSERAGLPLLRITSDLTHRKGRWSVLTMSSTASTSPKRSTKARSPAIFPGTNRSSSPQF